MVKEGPAAQTRQGFFIFSDGSPPRRRDGRNISSPVVLPTKAPVRRALM
jgi:hypothetical protein